MADQQGPKIIVDTDWKSQAQAERERLAATEKAKAPATKPASPGAGPEAGPGGEGEPAMPEASFAELVRMLATQALLYLGAFPDPESGRRLVSLELAQFNIDMLTMVEQKTARNLSEEEKSLLTRMLYELRMQFGEISKAVAKAVEQGKIAPGGGGGPGSAVNLRPPGSP